MVLTEKTDNRSKQTWSVVPSCQAYCPPFDGYLWILRFVSLLPRASLSWGPDRVRAAPPPPACHCRSAAVVRWRLFKSFLLLEVCKSKCQRHALHLLSHNHRSASISAVEAGSATAGCGHPSYGRPGTFSARTFWTHSHGSVIVSSNHWLPAAQWTPSLKYQSVMVFIQWDIWYLVSSRLIWELTHLFIFLCKGKNAP